MEEGRLKQKQARKDSLRTRFTDRKDQPSHGDPKTLEDCYIPHVDIPLASPGEKEVAMEPTEQNVVKYTRNKWCNNAIFRVDSNRIDGHHKNRTSYSKLIRKIID
jgi:hypothetical protein